MKYLVEFEEKDGNDSFIDSWDDDEISSTFMGVTSIEELDED